MFTSCYNDYDDAENKQRFFILVMQRINESYTVIILPQAIQAEWVTKWLTKRNISFAKMMLKQSLISSWWSENGTSVFEDENTRVGKRPSCCSLQPACSATIEHVLLVEQHIYCTRSSTTSCRSWCSTLHWSPSWERGQRISDRK